MHVGTPAWGCGLLPVRKLGVPPSCALSIHTSQGAALGHLRPRPRGVQGLPRWRDKGPPRGRPSAGNRLQCVHHGGSHVPGPPRAESQPQDTCLRPGLAPRPQGSGSHVSRAVQQGKRCGLRQPQHHADALRCALRGERGRDRTGGEAPGAGEDASSPGEVAAHPAAPADAPQRAPGPAAPVLAAQARKGLLTVWPPPAPAHITRDEAHARASKPSEGHGDLSFAGHLVTRTWCVLRDLVYHEAWAMAPLWTEVMVTSHSTQVGEKGRGTDLRSRWCTAANGTRGLPLSPTEDAGPPWLERPAAPGQYWAGPRALKPFWGGRNASPATWHFSQLVPGHVICHCPEQPQDSPDLGFHPWHGSLFQKHPPEGTRPRLASPLYASPAGPRFPNVEQWGVRAPNLA